MEKTFFAVKLIPPRPDFPMTMTDEEKAIMGAHAAYWKQHQDAGLVQVYGPVFDPKGPYGFGILAAESEDEVKAFIKDDPSLAFNTVEFYPMMAIFK
ncbi:YciI family protein [Flavobacterium sp. RHBU_3]|uniref:YciI family protein n=1 Tax=Flavobacterium sp. RHBU_3 TaxID=3391184 RepID=UPI0039852B86